MAEDLNFPPPSGVQYPGPPPSGVSSPSAPPDVFASRPDPRVGVGSPPPPPPVAVTPAQYGSPPPAGPGGSPAGYGPLYFAGVDSTDVALLDVPDAANPVAIVGLNGGHPEIYSGNFKASYDFVTGATIVSRLGGGTIKLKTRSNVQGYPIVKYGRREIFRLPRPSMADQIAIVSMKVTPMLYLGIIPGWFVGEYASRWIAGMVKRGESKWKRRLLPYALLSVIVAGVTALILAIALSS